MDDILILKNVSLTYQSVTAETHALDKIDVAVKRGEFVAIVGPSGCGKTTILSLVAGLIHPSSGEILLAGQTVNGRSQNVGYMLQRDSLLSWRTILDNTLLGLEIQKKKTPETVAATKHLLEKYGLGEFMNAHPSQLSGGMRQRAALIRTLAFNPEVLLLDEPFSALDFQTRLSVCDDVYAIIRAEKKTALLVTHDISEAVSLADRIIVLSSRPGRVRNIFTLDIDMPTPLKRREDPKFSTWFDRVWKEVSA